jgi:hypothetical protein
MLENITIGADPELFFERDGKVISAEGMIGGDKYNPKLIDKKGHAVLEDNVMAEFNIPPAKSKEDFVNSIEYVKEYLSEVARMNDASLNFSASAILPKKYLKTRQALEFGCMPDFNYYAKSMNDSPSSNSTMRTCGGHIHIGFKDPSQEKSEDMVLAMDATIGLKSLSIDTDDKRREMYGKAGSFRFKEFGVEYRTLSNFWIASEELVNWAYEETMKAVELVNSGGIEEVKKYSDSIEEAINTNNRELAKNLLEKFKQITTKELTI